MSPKHTTSLPVSAHWQWQPGEFHALTTCGHDDGEMPLLHAAALLDLHGQLDPDWPQRELAGLFGAIRHAVVSMADDSSPDQDMPAALQTLVPAGSSVVWAARRPRIGCHLQPGVCHWQQAWICFVLLPLQRWWAFLQLQPCHVRLVLHLPVKGTCESAMPYLVSQSMLSRKTWPSSPLQL